MLRRFIKRANRMAVLSVLVIMLWGEGYLQGVSQRAVSFYEVISGYVQYWLPLCDIRELSMYVRSQYVEGILDCTGPAEIEESLVCNAGDTARSCEAGCPIHHEEGCLTNFEEGCPTNFDEGCPTNFDEGCPAYGEGGGVSHSEEVCLVHKDVGELALGEEESREVREMPSEGVTYMEELTGDSTETGQLQMAKVEQAEVPPLHKKMPPQLRSTFVPPTKPQQVYTQEQLLDSAFVLQNFYAVDRSTQAPAEVLNPERLFAMDLSISHELEGPEILIYHTHSQEGYADSVEGQPETGIVEAGEVLARILRDTYGYEVLHHTGEYDTENHSAAYNNAEPAIRQILEENPSIQVVIDLHRDEVTSGHKLLYQYQGVDMAQFMFFNGISYTNEGGPLDYLRNDNLEMNLAMSLQMQCIANSYYPGLARRIYLRGYRYNMHLAPRYLLIELGAQNNTREEAANACAPLAYILHEVIQ